jgi:bisphosphoglycerate-dependent phosphoglycerate mutase
VIVGDLAAGKTVLIAAHDNSLRALVKHVDGISDAAIAVQHSSPAGQRAKAQKRQKP